MKVPEGIINFSVFGDGNEYFGMAEAQLPKVAHLTETIKGAGLAGEVESVFLGHISAMEMTLNFRAPTEAVRGLTVPTQHQLELRGAIQSREQQAGKLTTTAVKYVVIGQPKEVDLGKLAPAASADASVTLSVSYFAAYLNGKKTLEVDPINFIYEADGVDYLADVRRALGK